VDVFSTELGIRFNFVKASEFGGGGEAEPRSPRYATVNVYIYPKIAHNKVHIGMFINLRNPTFENKAGRSLSQDSSYLPPGTMCSSENPGCGDQNATTER
jgi:hypothetical protein